MSLNERIASNKKLSLKFLQKKNPQQKVIARSLIKDGDSVASKVITEIKNIMSIHQNYSFIEHSRKKEEYFLNFPENPIDMEKMKKITKNMVILMKQISGFNQFLKFNHIDDDSVRLALKFITHCCSIKGTYIFRQGDRSNKFYCILNGKVSIRVAKKPKFASKEDEDKLKKSKLKRTKSNSNGLDPYSTSLIFNSKNWLFKLIVDNEEEERICLESGMCFGERGLIYDIERNGSAYCIEDTDLLVLNKDIFLYAFGKQISKAETERKTFLCKVIPYLAEIPRSKFNEQYQKITTRFFQKDQIIYHENTDGAKFYIIYQGECMLEKKMKGKLERLYLVRMGIGDITGLEILFNSKGQYDYTLKCLVNNTIVIVLNCEIFSEFLNPILTSLKTLYKIKEDYYSKIIEKKKDFELKVNYKVVEKNSRSLENNLAEKEKIYQKNVHTLIKEINHENELKKIKNNLEKKKACSVSINSSYNPDIDLQVFKAEDRNKKKEQPSFNKTLAQKNSKGLLMSQIGSYESVELKKIDSNVGGTNKKMIRALSNDYLIKKNKSVKSKNSLASLKKAILNPGSSFYNSGKFLLPLVSKLSDSNIIN